MTDIGIINEQGDLGLGFEILDEQDQATIRQEGNTENNNEDGAM